ncbi:MAG: hypothetical protein ACQET6_14125 [Bacillota bacterium]
MGLVLGWWIGWFVCTWYNWWLLYLVHFVVVVPGTRISKPFEARNQANGQIIYRIVTVLPVFFQSWIDFSLRLSFSAGNMPFDWIARRSRG